MTYFTPSKKEEIIQKIFLWFSLSMLVVYVLSDNFMNQQFSLLADSFLKGKLYFNTLPNNKVDLVLRNGKFFWPLSPFPAVLLMPFAFITSLFGTFFPQNLVHLALVLGTYFLIFKIARDFKFSPKDAYYMAFGFCCASVYLFVAFISASWYFSHVVAVFFSFLSIYEYLHRKRYWLIGLLCSFVFLTRVTAGFLVFFFVLEIIFSESKKVSKEKMQSLVSLLIPMVIAGVLNLLYNYFRFGNPFDNGYKSGNAFWLTDAERFEQINYGLFQLRNIPTNIYYYFLKGIDPVLINFRSCKYNTYILKPPYIKVGYPGISFFVASPMFLYIFKSDFSLRWVRHATLVILLTLFVLLTYYWPGWIQIGPRYMLDLLPLSLIVLFSAFRDGRPLPTLFKVAVYGGAMLNMYLLFTMKI